MSPSPDGVMTTSQDSAGNSDGGGGDAAEASGGSQRRWRRPGWRQVWNKERLQLLRHAQDNAARQRRQLQLRRVTDELLEALRELEGPDLRWDQHHQQGQQHHHEHEQQQHHHHHQQGQQHHHEHEQQQQQQPSRWVSDQLDLLVGLDLVEPAAARGD